MNITINRAELLNAVQKASAIASEDAPLEPLKGVLLEADAAAGTLTLTATNIETSLEQKLAFQSERDALLYTALLQTAGFRPRNNLSCSQCYSEYLKSSGLSVE